MITKGVASLIVAALSGTGVATWVDINSDVAVNASAIEHVEEVHSLDLGYIKKELQEIKQLIKDG